MLDNNTKKLILDSVREKPRSIDELSGIIQKNWRTADRYVQRIAEEEGSISVRTFREGTRGALKIVYWVSPDSIHSSEFQERLFKQIEAGRRKMDFSPSEIYQYVASNQKEGKILKDKDYASQENFNDFKNRLLSAKSEIFFFSGNLTFSNIGDHDTKIREIIGELARNGVHTKILTRVEIPGLDSVKKLLEINNKLGKKMIEVRHCYQPLRTTIVDDKVVSFKETRDPKYFPKEELAEKITILYYVYDKDWVDWMKKVFWALFRSSISAEKRIEDIERMKFTDYTKNKFKKFI